MKVELCKTSMWFFCICVWEINSSVLDKLDNNDYYKHQTVKSNELGTDGKTGISAYLETESFLAITKRMSSNLVFRAEFGESSCL